jgi:hypothetical protein
VRFARHFRLFVLLSVLAGVIVYAWRDVSRRRERNEWQRTLDVAFVVVTDGDVDADAATTLMTRVPALASRMHEELRRYHPGALKPFAFTTFGPHALPAPVPGTPDGAFGLVKHAYELHRFTSAVDEALHVPSRGFDARLYLVARPPTDQALVEGMSEHGGRIGLALAELDSETVDTALIVAAHELFHTLGASDRYGPDGRALVPFGLAEPSLEPLYPQRFAEIMARNRPLSPTTEARPVNLAEVRVGEATAREIGWVR